MIQQVLSRDFVLNCMADVANYLEQVALLGERRGEETDLSNLNSAERLEIVEEIRNAQKSEEVSSSGQKGFDVDTSRRDDTVVPIDEVSFFSQSYGWWAPSDASAWTTLWCGMRDRCGELCKAILPTISGPVRI